MFSEDSLEELKDRTSLSYLLDDFEVDSRVCYECPFCGGFDLEIDEEDRNYKCFACDAEGDAMDFLMHHGNLSFKKSAELLADMFEVDLKEIENDCDKVDIRDWFG